MICKMHVLLCLAFLIFALAVLQVSGARGSRGGSYRGSSYRSSSRRNSKRYGSSRGVGYTSLSMLVSKRFSYRASRSAYSRGIFFAPWSWRRSRPDYDSADTTLCFNVVDNVPSEYNSSVVEPWLYQNRTGFGQLDRVYCCGDKDRQICCSFWEDTGRVVGLIIGTLVGIGFCAFFAVRIRRNCIRRQQGGNSQPQSTIAMTTRTVASDVPMEAIMAPQACGYPQYEQHQPPTTGSDFSKQQPPGYSRDEQSQPPNDGQPPYPTVAPPSYWEVSGSEPLPPVRF